MSIARANCRFEFEKRCQLFIGTYNEPLSVAAMALCHEETVQRTLPAIFAALWIECPPFNKRTMAHNT
jgi:hypothetical protein